MPYQAHYKWLHDDSDGGDGGGGGGDDDDDDDDDKDDGIQWIWLVAVTPIFK